MGEWWTWRKSFQGELGRLSNEELQAYAARCDDTLDKTYDRWRQQMIALETARGDYHAALNELNRVGHDHRTLMDERQAILEEDGKRRAFVVVEPSP